MGGESTEFLKRFVEEFHCLKGIVLSESEGMLICHSVPQKDSEKFIQATSMLISALKQAQGNLQKVTSRRCRRKPTARSAQSTITTRRT